MFAYAIMELIKIFMTCKNKHHTAPVYCTNLKIWNSDKASAFTLPLEHIFYTMGVVIHICQLSHDYHTILWYSLSKILVIQQVSNIFCGMQIAENHADNL